MRLGIYLGALGGAEEWARAHAELELGACYWPLDPDAPEGEIDAYARAAREHGLVIAEVGAWCNLLDADPAKRERNILYVTGRLRLAGRVGARCCVNISGSLSETWDGPHPDNLSAQTFGTIVDITRRIIDTAAPAGECRYSLEPMPWMYPFDAESTLDLISAVDRENFGVHVDMCNMMNSPDKVYNCGRITRDYFERLGPHICSIHAKDVRLSPHLTTHIDEALPGEGHFDFDTLLKCASELGDVPIMLEHLSSHEEYLRGAAHLKAVAERNNLSFTRAF